MASMPPTERWSERTYSPRQSATRTFDVPGYDTGTAAISAVINNFGVRPGTPYPDDNFLFIPMEGISARNNEGPTTWIVTVQYAYLAQAAFGVGDNPLSNPTVWEVHSGLEGVSTETDSWGYPITNSAGDPPDSLADMTITTLTIRATKHYLNYSIAQALKYMNKVNSTPVTLKTFGTLLPGQVKCKLICPTSQIIISQQVAIEVVTDFEVRSPRISGSNDDPAFAYSMIDRGWRGWWNNSDVPTQGDFSEPDPTTPGRYKSRTLPTLLNGRGQPLDPTIKIGETGKTPITTPPYIGLSPFANVQKTGDRRRILFPVSVSADLGPLIASL